MEKKKFEEKWEEAEKEGTKGLSEITLQYIPKIYSGCPEYGIATLQFVKVCAGEEKLKGIEKIIETYKEKAPIIFGGIFQEIIPQLAWQTYEGTLYGGIPSKEKLQGIIEFYSRPEVKKIVEKYAKYGEKVAQRLIKEFPLIAGHKEQEEELIKMIECEKIEKIFQLYKPEIELETVKERIISLEGIEALAECISYEAFYQLEAHKSKTPEKFYEFIGELYGELKVRREMEAWKSFYRIAEEEGY